MSPVKTCRNEAFPFHKAVKELPKLTKAGESCCCQAATLAYGPVRGHLTARALTDLP